MSKSKYYVYTYAYPDGRVFYVGKGTGKRISEHEWEAKRKMDRNAHKCNVIRKIWANGEQVVKKKEARFENEQDALMYEIALIFFLRPYGILTNVTDGGDGASGRVASEATRQGMSEKRKGKPSGRKGKSHSEASRQKMSLARKGKPAPNKGKPMSEEQKQKLKGKKFSEEHLRNMSIAQKGKRFSKYAPQNASSMTDEEYKRACARLKQADYRQKQRLRKERKASQLTFEEIAS